MDSEIFADDGIIIRRIIDLNSAVVNLKSLDITIENNEVKQEIETLPDINFSLSALDSRTWDDELGIGLLLHLIKRMRRRSHMSKLFKTINKVKNAMLRIKKCL